MIESLLRQFLASRYRRWIVITGTFLIGVAVGWPAADEYFALRDRSDRLAGDLQNIRNTAANLPKIEQQAGRKAAQLQELEAKLVDERSANEYRAWIGEQIRQAGCQMRKVRVGTPTSRRWREEGNPIETVSTEGTETNYTLKALPVTVSASGSLSNVKDLLSRLQKAEKMLHTKRFSLRPEGTDGKEVVLELEIILFDLHEAENKPV